MARALAGEDLVFDALMPYRDGSPRQSEIRYIPRRTAGGGVEYALPPDVLAAALPVARAVPDGDARLLPGAAFAPALPVPPGADPLTELLALLGRSRPRAVTPPA